MSGLREVAFVPAEAVVSLAAEVCFDVSRLGEQEVRGPFP